MAAIYSIRNVVNGKRYVGSAVRPAARWACHKSRLRRRTHHSRHLQRAWDKHGEVAFIFEVLQEIPDGAGLKSRLQAAEQAWMASYDVVTSGYNVSPNAGTSLGTKRTPEQTARMAAARTGVKLGPHTAETKQKISRSQAGKPRCAMSPATCEKIVLAHRGRPKSAVHRQNISAAKKGVLRGPMSAAHRAAISASLRGRERTQEHKASISAALSRAWAEGRKLQPKSYRRAAAPV